ncbi:hypothetical protein DXG01_011624, partial [Tephrocybe rancida]
LSDVGSKWPRRERRPSGAHESHTALQNVKPDLVSVRNETDSASEIHESSDSESDIDGSDLAYTPPRSVVHALITVMFAKPSDPPKIRWTAVSEAEVQQELALRPLPLSSGTTIELDELGGFHFPAVGVILLKVRAEKPWVKTTKLETALRDAGIASSDQIILLPKEDLEVIGGMGPEAARMLRNYAKRLVFSLLGFTGNYDDPEIVSGSVAQAVKGPHSKKRRTC